MRYSDNVPPIVGVNPLGGKYSRAQAVTPFVCGRRVHLCTDWTDAERRDVEPSNKTPLEPHQEFVEQLARFPYAKNDDMVDACTQGIARVIKLMTGEEPIPHRRQLRFVHWYPDMWEDFDQLDAVEQERYIQIHGAPEEWREYYNN